MYEYSNLSVNCHCILCIVDVARVTCISASTYIFEYIPVVHFVLLSYSVQYVPHRYVEGFGFSLLPLAAPRVVSGRRGEVRNRAKSKIQRRSEQQHCNSEHKRGTPQRSAAVFTKRTPQRLVFVLSTLPNRTIKASSPYVCLS
jgi:hypothetical protein